MKKGILKWLTLACCCAAFSLSAADEVSDATTGQTFPKQVTFDFEGKNYVLDATGTSTRKKFMVKVYSVASYLQQGAAITGNKFEQFLTDDKAKQLTLKWVRAASVDQVQKGYEESFKNSLSTTEFNALKGDIAKYLAFFAQPVEKGDEQVLRWIPGGTVEVLIKGNSAGTITNPVFAKALWNLWFGDKSVVNRDGLVSLIK